VVKDSGDSGGSGKSGDTVMAMAESDSGHSDGNEAKPVRVPAFGVVWQKIIEK
jgi:hypothetical protein